MTAKKNTDIKKTEDQLIIEEFSNEIESTDYGFVFDQDGQLKAVYVPTHGCLDIPQSIKKVFKLAGIHDPQGVEIHTIH